jgi:predicted nuclease of predicted toxin-antitoxin system
VRILANENFPIEAVEALKEVGYDVVWIRADAPGSSDEAVLALAQAENRIVLTFDKDFGELAYRSKLPVSTGIILFRISAPSSAHVARVAVAVLQSRTDWVGNFSVVEDRRIRMIPLPKPG